MMQQEEKSRIWVSNWLFVGVAMLVVQVILGGITRLTGSGLSIMEWDPIICAIPPPSESQWQHAFQHYQQIAQFK
jgi:cytochrome c oxidase assembly protein subunit 15